MQTRLETGPNEVKTMSTAELRSNFLIESLMETDKVNSVYSAYDRMVIGGAKPVYTKLTLDTSTELKSEYFLERREVGIINVGGSGSIEVDGHTYTVERLSCLYIGKGSKQVIFSSHDPANPALLFFMSTPAHAAFETQLFTKEDALPVVMGEAQLVNKRTIYKYIHKDGIQSCQLVMGLTVLAECNVWNTMPAHTHLRRSEAYFYFDMDANTNIIHLMGQPSETRHMIVRNNQAIISPPWSIHSGAGTSSYSFIWAMGGENQDFTDMDFVPMQELF